MYAIRTFGILFHNSVCVYVHRVDKALKNYIRKHLCKIIGILEIFNNTLCHFKLKFTEIHTAIVNFVQNL